MSGTTLVIIAVVVVLLVVVALGARRAMGRDRDRPAPRRASSGYRDDPERPPAPPIGAAPSAASAAAVVPPRSADWGARRRNALTAAGDRDAQLRAQRSELPARHRRADEDDAAALAGGAGGAGGAVYADAAFVDPTPYDPALLDDPAPAIDPGAFEVAHIGSDADTGRADDPRPPAGWAPDPAEPTPPPDPTPAHTSHDSGGHHTPSHDTGSSGGGYDSGGSSGGYDSGSTGGSSDSGGSSSW